MSRLDKAIAAIDEAVADLSSAIEAHLAADKAAHELAQLKSDQIMSDQIMSDSQLADADKAASPNGLSPNGVSQDELQAMKSELHEAMSLLQAIQDVPQSKEGQ